MRILLIALLLFPLCTNAQLVEVSVKTGTTFNNIGHQATSLVDVKKPLSYGGSLCATIGLPGGIRVGAAISAYKVQYSTILTFPNGITSATKYSYGQPLMPVELVAVKRIKVSKLSVDIGGCGGVCTNNKTKILTDDVQTPFILKDKNTWFSYGLLAGAQYSLSKKLSVGIEAQPKWINMQRKNSNFFMTAALVKVSYGLL